MSILANLRPRSAHLSSKAAVRAEVEDRCSTAWCRYFRRNKTRLIHIPWERGAELTAAESAVVLSSIQDFQLGESSDGSNGRAMAERYAESSGDRSFVTAMELFIAEEQRHGRDLGRFLDLAGMPRLRISWTDCTFRWLRHGKGLEMVLVTALMAELVARVYYRALFHATKSVVLRRLCAQLLRDERQHVAFDVERLGLIRRGRSSWLTRLANAAQRVLFAGTCMAVWWKHGGVLRLGGYDFRRYWQAVWAEYAKSDCGISAAVEGIQG